MLRKQHYQCAEAQCRYRQYLQDAGGAQPLATRLRAIAEQADLIDHHDGRLVARIDFIILPVLFADQITECLNAGQLRRSARPTRFEGTRSGPEQSQDRDRHRNLDTTRQDSVPTDHDGEERKYQRHQSRRGSYGRTGAGNQRVASVRLSFELRIEERRVLGSLLGIANQRLSPPGRSGRP